MALIFILNPLIVVPAVHQIKLQPKLNASYSFKIILLGVVIQIFCMYRFVLIWLINFPLKSVIETTHKAGYIVFLVSYLVIVELGA